MTKKQQESLEHIENQLYAINARNISMQWIGLQKTPTMKEIEDLNSMLAFIIKELRTLRQTGSLDIEKLHTEFYKNKL